MDGHRVNDKHIQWDHLCIKPRLLKCTMPVWLHRKAPRAEKTSLDLSVVFLVDNSITVKSLHGPNGLIRMNVAYRHQPRRVEPTDTVASN